MAMPLSEATMFSTSLPDVDLGHVQPLIQHFSICSSQRWLFESIFNLQTRSNHELIGSDGMLEVYAIRVLPCTVILP